MDKRTGKGRQKIEMKLIESKEACTVTFSKRKKGLFKKADEYSTLIGADVGIILFSPAGKPHYYGSPSIEEVADKFHELKQNNSQRDHIGMGKTNVFEAFEDLRKEVQALNEKDPDLEIPPDKHMLEHRLEQFEAFKSRLDKIKKERKCNVPTDLFKFDSEVAPELEEEMSS